MARSLDEEVTTNARQCTSSIGIKTPTLQLLTCQHLETAGVHFVYVVQSIYFTTTLPASPSETATPFATSAFAARTRTYTYCICPYSNNAHVS